MVTTVATAVDIMVVDIMVVDTMAVDTVDQGVNG
jgi:hypothetical protein